MRGCAGEALKPGSPMPSSQSAFRRVRYFLPAILPLRIRPQEDSRDRLPSQLLRGQNVLALDRAFNQ
jgi:hypothetical protein